ncbi:MAG: prenyltransferase/squalene oxidase repeat-containing protein [Kiritimatiellia bacterium]
MTAGKTNNLIRRGNSLALRAAPLILFAVIFLPAGPGAEARGLRTYHGDPIPDEIEAMYAGGLNFLASSQTPSGCWSGSHGSEPGVTALAVLAFLAHGDDPDYGPYAGTVRKGLDFILSSANDGNGYIGPSMYNHGFATLALAEAYGMADDRRLGPALKKAVGLIITSQSQNRNGGWRYSPESHDADTTVSGAQMAALFAARNAGIAVPDSSIKAGIKFYKRCQSGNGGFGYTGPGTSSPARSAIGALVFALAGKKDSPEFKSALLNLQQTRFESGSYAYYYAYYAAQAFFQGDMKRWNAWNKSLIERLKRSQDSDGAWNGNHGTVFSTSAALLSLAVNYRFLPIYER